ncbi:PH domain-containing protein [Streptomyces sp. Z26]|uniref:PH domain-containing protein n=1 Tax=Streptomyces TaxID=1883 RepID=UPI000EF163A0|nr:PH domain-containing protein [Streptomyces sp. Z26]RLL68267.1 hypothetical protein D7M15_17055 [Streptomyces sp. Z26]
MTTDGDRDGTGAGIRTGAGTRTGAGGRTDPGADAAPEPTADPAPDPYADTPWRPVEPALLRLRRLVLLGTLLPAAALAGVLPAVFAAPVWALCALPPLAAAGWGWGALARNWRSWRYAERADDLLISRGVLWRGLTVVPYGRMQLVEVTSGPLERRHGLARLQLHTAAATTDATIPGLSPAEAERLRDRLTELGEARSAGL